MPLCQASATNSSENKLMIGLESIWSIGKREASARFQVGWYLSSIYDHNTVQLSLLFPVTGPALRLGTRRQTTVWYLRLKLQRLLHLPEHAPQRQHIFTITLQPLSPVPPE